MKSKQNRISEDDYFMSITQLVAQRATCLKRKFGCIIVKDKKIVATGYNGSPRGMEHCIDIGCLEQNKHCIRCIHAEQNALLQADRHLLDNSKCYTTGIPCPICFKLLIQAGIKEVVYLEDYKLKEVQYWIENGGIRIRKHGK